MRCEHDSCHCEATDGRFCSAYCANAAAEREEGLCSCGHDGCHPEHEVHGREPQVSIGRGPGAGIVDQD